ncbi:MAG: aminotransferase class I/II-fold pyridoxal phosphate-dependent enzyme [candidate division Zixibacteria bacterium]|nr:aminotransferase class I/II-fold pyridoxal phosphate-dependent enzyme [candidate division Zixibacteria bacterium]
MRSISTIDHQQVTDLTRTLGRRLMVTPESIYPFMDFDDLMPELLKLVTHRCDRIIGGGHLSPDILIAADRANLHLHEVLSVSPFSLDCDNIASQVTSPKDIIYISNPNRATGANVGLADLRHLLEQIPDGILIVDEYYYDYYGITAIPLLQQFSNVVILRSFAASFGVGSAEAGFVVASPTIIEHLAELCNNRAITATKFRVLATTLENDQALNSRLRLLHDEMLRVSTILTRQGIQNRITAADFLLIRVADITAAGNQLAKHKVQFDNLDGYPQLKGYLRYKVQSESSNDLLINAFAKMPLEHYRIAGVDLRVTTLKRPTEVVVEDPVIHHVGTRHPVPESSAKANRKGSRPTQVTR